MTGENGGDITYPSYTVKTLSYIGNCTYSEESGDVCPCDLGANAAKDANLNTIIADVAASVS